MNGSPKQETAQRRSQIARQGIKIMPRPDRPPETVPAATPRH